MKKVIYFQAKDDSLHLTADKCLRAEKILAIREWFRGLTRTEEENTMSVVTFFASRLVDDFDFFQKLMK